MAELENIVGRRAKAFTPAEEAEVNAALAILRSEEEPVDWQTEYAAIKKEADVLARFADWCLNGDGATFEFAPEDLTAETREALDSYMARVRERQA